MVLSPDLTRIAYWPRGTCIRLEMDKTTCCTCLIPLDVLPHHNWRGKVQCSYGDLAYSFRVLSSHGLVIKEAQLLENFRYYAAYHIAGVWQDLHRFVDS